MVAQAAAPSINGDGVIQRSVCNTSGHEHVLVCMSNVPDGRGGKLGPSWPGTGRTRQVCVAYAMTVLSCPGTYLRVTAPSRAHCKLL